MTADKKAAPSDLNANVSWENFVKFVRQLSHDLRNQLNAAELQSALIGELTSDPELKSEVRRLRELVSQLGGTLQHLSAAVAEPRPTRLPYAAQDFIADVQKKIAQDFPDQAQKVKWEVASDSAMLNIDPELTEWAAAELFNNAFRHDPAAGHISATVSAGDQWFTFSIREPKSKEVDPAQWVKPLQSVSHGHYCLGLRRARGIVAAHGGELIAQFDPDSRILTTTMTLPCSTESR